MTMATEVLPRPSSIGRSTSPICRKEPLLTRPSIETEDLTRFVKVPLENATGNTGNNTDTVSSPAKAAKSAVSPSIYNALVIDSGAIIKCSGLRTLHNSAKSYYAPESVLKEILDSKSKEHLKNLPFSLQVKEPSLQSCKTISRFARLTGDYNSLSFTDIQVLALVYDLEKEGCQGSMEHIRTEPKRMLGLGGGTQGNESEAPNDCDTKKCVAIGRALRNTTTPAESLSCATVKQNDEGDDKEEHGHSDLKSSHKTILKKVTAPRSWAALVSSPQAVSASDPADGGKDTHKEDPQHSQTNINVQMADLKIRERHQDRNVLSMNFDNVDCEDDLGGQFSDAEYDAGDDGYDRHVIGKNFVEDIDCIDCGDQKDDDRTESEDDGKDHWRGNNESDDEECSFNIVADSCESAKDKGEEKVEKSKGSSPQANDLKFPSLAAASKMPKESSDERQLGWRTRMEEADQGSITKGSKTRSGRTLRYNSFRNYRDLVSANGASPVGTSAARNKASRDQQSRIQLQKNNSLQTVVNNSPADNPIYGRVRGADTGFSCQFGDAEDDGEGWVTLENITTVCAAGASSLMGKGNLSRDDVVRETGNQSDKLPVTKRCACATTDFAMQNVLLQMGFALLSVDGVVIRRVKQWVTRCYACFATYGASGRLNGSSNFSAQQLSSRLFCPNCGSDALERVSACVDGKTGRIRLFLTQKKRVKNLRGTKFSLPNPGKGNRFEGDLLLREDQLLMGAWNQKIKMGGKSLESMFGSDIASGFGLSDVSKRDDIKVGFGRRNPNATKFGRERRGKKKKTAEKACGLRRYA